MIRTYYLETVRIDNTDTVKGIEYIHNAVLDVEGTLRKLIQDTTAEEHNGLIAVAVSWREATQDEVTQLEALPPPPPPQRNPLKEIDEIKASLTTLIKKVDSITTRSKEVIL